VDIESNQEPRIIKIEKGTSEKERKNIINLVKDHRDVFAFTHDELKAYNEDVIQHTIPLKEYAKPFREKLRQINHKLAPMVQKKLHRMQFRARLIIWLSWMKTRRKAFNQSIRNQDKVKRASDMSSQPRTFQKGDTVLLRKEN
jgi:hypothetical protein